MKLIKYILIGGCLLLNAGLLVAQTFQVSMVDQGARLSVKAKLVGGNLTTGFANMEFYVRYPSSQSILWGVPTANTTNFPGIVIQKNDPYTTITEAGYTIVRFFLPPGTFGTSRTFVEGEEYEVFSVATTIQSASNIEMMHQDFENPYVLTMVNESATAELTDNVKFYGPGASTSGATQSLPLSLAIVLPLELTDFGAKADGKTNKVAWQTRQEANTSHFIVEKKPQGAQKFMPIGEVKAKGQSDVAQSYELFDQKTSYLDYYRLKMVDRDGQFTYSKTVSVARAETKMEVAFYPNPTSHFLNVQLAHNQYTTAEVQIVDVTGRTVAAQPLNNKNNGLFLVDVQHLASGVYTAVVQVDDKQFLQKVVIDK